jgi:hypothetical protein
MVQEKIHGLLSHSKSLSFYIASVSTALLSLVLVVVFDPFLSFPLARQPRVIFFLRV